MKNISVIYWSGTGNTEEMARAIAEGAGINPDKVNLLKVEVASKDDVIAADAVALGCPPMGSESLEEDFMEPFVESLKDVDFSGKQVALFGSYDWGGGEWMSDWESKMQGYGANLIQDGLIINLTPDEEGIKLCKQLGEKLAKA